MNAAEAEVGFEELVARYSLRYVERTRRYLGIHEGLGIDVSLFHQCIALTAFSPSAVVNGQILEDFSGFTHVKNLGVPTSWINGVPLSTRENSPHLVRLELTPQRMSLLSKEQLLGLPACLMQDFRLFGAEPAIHSCQFCSEPNPSNLLDLGTAYAPACNNCVTRIPDDAAMGLIDGANSVRWPHAILGLLSGGAIFAYLWGLMQQGETTMKVLLFVPFFAAIGLAVLVLRCAGGVNLPLRWLTACVSVLAVFAGNIWGVRTNIEAGLHHPVAWEDAVRFYFQHYLPANTETEGIFLLGGLAGTWVANSALKALSRFRAD